MNWVTDYRALLERSGQGFVSWNGVAPAGAFNVVTYAFLERADLPEPDWVDSSVDGVFSFSRAQRAAARTAFDKFDAASGLVFVEVERNAMVEVFGMSGSDAYGYGWSPDHSISWSGVSIDGSARTDFSPGTIEFETLLHEIGHALGLKHPHEGSPRLREDLDHTDNTVMSYNKRSDFEDALRRLDRDALERLYGRDYDPAARGLHWTVQKEDGMIRLSGGSGEDAIVAAGWNCNVSAKAGDDAIYCLGGYVRAWGGSGRDDFHILGGETIAFGGSDGDRFFLLDDSAARAARLRGGDGSDEVRLANAGAVNLDDSRRFKSVEAARGSEEDDRLAASDHGSRLYGEGGEDELSGRAGRDRLWGGSGADSLSGGGGNDQLRGGSGRDVLSGGSRNDILHGDEGADALQGGSGRDILKGGSGRDKLDGGTSDDVLCGGSGADLFVFSRGADRVTDFEDGLDLIRVSGRFEDFTISARDGSTRIERGEDRLTLDDVDAACVGREDFMFV